MSNRTLGLGCLAALVAAALLYAALRFNSRRRQKAHQNGYVDRMIGISLGDNRFHIQMTKVDQVSDLLWLGVALDSPIHGDVVGTWISPIWLHRMGRGGPVYVRKQKPGGEFWTPLDSALVFYDHSENMWRAAVFGNDKIRISISDAHTTDDQAVTFIGVFDAEFLKK
ncbi:MAG TPA: hypothetical protein VM581_04730 [Magnetospirillaceae bacterium]|nr:hypothetical protein [Magnetospirillaceae bacterium]